ncbi:MAG TPA: hypothetical protein VMF65_22480, partial [Acidimicrobiales bacterium]|nr:hypothetical protein [Acidimicrobiales bacterium]
TPLSGLVALAGGGTAATEAFIGGSSLVVAAMSTLALGALALAAGAHWRAARSASRRWLALTMMEREVVRGYLTSPPHLLQPTDAGTETRLAALAALAARQIRMSPARDYDMPGMSVDLDQIVVGIYERAYQIKQGRQFVAAPEPRIYAEAITSAERDIGAACEFSMSALTEQVRLLCLWASRLAGIERLLRDEARLAALTGPGTESLIYSLLSDGARGEFAVRELDARCRELHEVQLALTEKAKLLSEFD